VALVGESGAGKTTIAGVLVRFLELDGGRATLDGHDLGAYASDDVRGLVALAGQTPPLLHDHPRERPFRPPGSSDEEIAAALGARRLGLGFVPPGGARHLRGRDGRSGLGRPAAADRAGPSLPLRRPLLILDEPTAQLDRATAEAILDDLFAAGTDDAGLLVITHDELMLDRFDAVLRLENGRVV